MNLADILKDSDYKLSQFKAEEIDSLEQAIFLKQTKNGDVPYWIAILSPADDLRAKAVNLSNTLEPFQIVTSEVVFTEVLNSFSRRESAFRQAVAQFVQRSFGNPKIEVVPQTSDLFHQAIDPLEDFLR